MCGIVLVIKEGASIDANSLLSATNTMRHRGPDASGTCSQNFDGFNIGLGHRRLSILDLSSKGQQPMIFENLSIVYNGEVYNFKEIRDELRGKGYQFESDTDTEVILKAYHCWRSKALERFRGMFAFCIFDSKSKTVFCARDRLGIKPLYYYVTDKFAVFASEMKAITFFRMKLHLDYEALDQYFAYGCTMGDKTIYKEVKKLEPANFAEISLGGHGALSMRRAKYWNLECSPDTSKSEEEWCELLEHTLSEAVNLRLISDVPLGAFLSGGVDSSAVVAFMSTLSNSPVKTFSIGFKEEKYNELEFAKAVSQKYATEHHELIVEKESVEHMMPRIVQIYDEPFADSSALPTYYVSKFASEHVKVVLSGDGGDELFAGYDSYSKFSRIRNMSLPSPARFLFSLLYRVTPGSLLGRRTLYYLGQNPNHLGAFYSILNQVERTRLYTPETRQSIGNLHAEGRKTIMLDKYLKSGFVEGLELLDVNSYLVDDILTKVDRASMAHSIEARVPLLDHKFVELCFRIPSELKLKKGKRKLIFKKMLQNKDMPSSVILHKKQGFALPISTWFKGSLKDYLAEKLSDKRKSIYSYLDYKEVDSMLKNHFVGGADLSNKIWELLVFDEWLEYNGRFFEA